MRFQNVWEQRICYALPNFVKRRFAFVITERDPLDTNPEVAAEFLMECAKGRFARFETIDSCFGEDASQFTGRLTLIRTYMEAETRDSRRKLAEVDEGILAKRRSLDRSHPSDLATRRRRAFVCRRKFMSFNHR